MARIRTIKPEFYDSPGIETLEFQWRLLYVAMWNWADDTGRGKAEARELMGFVFPRDEDMTVVEFRRGLGEVRRVFGVNFYKVEGRSYYLIPAWDKHQKIDKRSGSRWPGPDEGESYDPSEKSPTSSALQAYSAETHETPPRVRRDPGVGTGEQGNRGTGEQGKEKTCPATQDEFLDWYLIYPRKEARGLAEKAYMKARKKVSAEVLAAAAQRYVDDPNREKQFTKLPASWLNAESWDDEPLPARSGSVTQLRPTGSQVRLQAGLELIQRTQARQQERAQPQFEIED